MTLITYTLSSVKRVFHYGQSIHDGVCKIRKWILTLLRVTSIYSFHVNVKVPEDQ